MKEAGQANNLSVLRFAVAIWNMCTMARQSALTKTSSALFAPTSVTPGSNWSVRVSGLRSIFFSYQFGTTKY